MKPDMSPGAVTARLKRTSELREICMALKKSKLQNQNPKDARNTEKTKNMQLMRNV